MLEGELLGLIWDLSEDFFNSSQFVKTIQDRQGLLVCSPHEIAYRNGYIDSKRLKIIFKA